MIATTLSPKRGLMALALLLCQAVAQAANCPALLDRQALRLQDEKPQNLCQYSGRVVLVVNTASFCGFTPQYKSLEALNDRYRARGLVVLGFPANNFGSQEPGSNAEIAEFCENQFAVHFPMFAKSSVLKTAKAPVNPLFAALSARTGQAPKWNFHKYIVDRRGDIVISHDSEVDPLDPIFVKDIERLLAAKQ